MPDHFYVYPAYLERGMSRAEGRRVPAGRAPAEVTVETIVAAAKRLGFVAEAEPERQYPRQAHRFEGRVKVAKRAGYSKARALREIADELVRRSAAPGAA